MVANFMDSNDTTDTRGIKNQSACINVTHPTAIEPLSPREKPYFCKMMIGDKKTTSNILVEM